MSCVRTVLANQENCKVRDWYVCDVQMDHMTSLMLGFVSELTQTPGNHVSRDRKREVFSGNDGLRRSP